MKYAKKTYKPRKTTKKTKTVSDTVKAYVKKAIHVQAENKIASNYKDSNLPLIPYGNSTALGITLTTIVPLQDALNLSQGAGQGDRIGNSIRPRSFMLRGHIIAASTENADSPILARMVIFKRKQDIEIPTDLSDLFQSGNTSVAPTNLPTDMYLPLNKEDYIIYKERKFSVTRNDNDSFASANGTNLIQFFKQDLTKYIPKKLTYADAAVDPTNCGIYLICLMCKADGSAFPAASVTGTTQLQLSYSVNLIYEDL